MKMPKARYGWSKEDYEKELAKIEEEKQAKRRKQKLIEESQKKQEVEVILSLEDVNVWQDQIKEVQESFKSIQESFKEVQEAQLKEIQYVDNRILHATAELQRVQISLEESKKQFESLVNIIQEKWNFIVELEELALAWREKKKAREKADKSP